MKYSNYILAFNIQISSYSLFNLSCSHGWLTDVELRMKSEKHKQTERNCNETRTHNHLVRKRTLNHLAKLEKWFSCVMSTVHLTVCSYYVTYESTVYSYLNAKKLFAQNRRDIWSLSNCNKTRNHNHLVCKHLFRLRTEWLWVRAPLQSLKLQISSLI